MRSRAKQVEGPASVSGRLVVLLAAAAMLVAGMSPARTGIAGASSEQPGFRIGEKLTYQISFGKFVNAGFAELSVISRGKLGGKNGRDVVELRSRIKTLDVVSAVFLQMDEERTSYVAPESGLPVYIVRTNNDGPVPKESISNFLSQPTQNFDLLSLIYKAREQAGNGNFQLAENEQVYAVTFATTGAERIKTDAGEFDTTISTVTSDFLTVNGIRDLRINFSVDEHRIPVRIRFRAARGEVSANLSAIALPEPEPSPTSTPAPVATPSRTPLQIPSPTPDPYVDNQPLNPEIGFPLGETLEYRLRRGGQDAGMLTLSAAERKRFRGEDSLLLTAVVTGVEGAERPFRLGDSFRVQVDPETLAPRWMESKFPASVPELNQTVVVDKVNGDFRVGSATVDAPMGTHTILSLLYAMRSFNLKPSRTPNSPVNDTRVAVFWSDQTYVFSLRASPPADIVLNGQAVSAQQITINTRNPQLDALTIRVWLSTQARIPLRVAFGPYEADLTSRNIKAF